MEEVGNRTRADAQARAGQKRRKQRRVILVGHFAPPIHGMAIAMDALATLLESEGPVTRIRTVPKQPVQGGPYHVTRACLVTVAAWRMLLLRKESKAVFLSVDAGYGMVYVIALTWVARLPATTLYSNITQGRICRGDLG